MLTEKNILITSCRTDEGRVGNSESSGFRAGCCDDETEPRSTADAGRRQSVDVASTSSTPQRRRQPRRLYDDDDDATTTRRLRRSSRSSVDEQRRWPDQGRREACRRRPYVSPTSTACPRSGQRQWRGGRWRGHTVRGDWQWRAEGWTEGVEVRSRWRDATSWQVTLSLSSDPLGHRGAAVASSHATEHRQVSAAQQYRFFVVKRATHRYDQRQQFSADSRTQWAIMNIDDILYRRSNNFKLRFLVVVAGLTPWWVLCVVLYSSFILFCSFYSVYFAISVILLCMTVNCCEINFMHYNDEASGVLLYVCLSVFRR